MEFEQIYKATDLILKLVTAILMPILAWIIHNIMNLTKRITSIEIKTNEIISNQIIKINDQLEETNTNMQDKFDKVYKTLDDKLEKMEGNVSSKLDLVIKLIRGGDKN
jgi:uncharacterized coiled-coil protein SlyX